MLDLLIIFLFIVLVSSGSKPKRPSFVIKKSTYYKCSPKATAVFKNRSKQFSK